MKRKEAPMVAHVAAVAPKIQFKLHPYGLLILKKGRITVMADMAEGGVTVVEQYTSGSRFTDGRIQGDRMESIRDYAKKIDEDEGLKSDEDVVQALYCVVIESLVQSVNSETKP